MLHLTNSNRLSLACLTPYQLTRVHASQNQLANLQTHGLDENSIYQGYHYSSGIPRNKKNSNRRESLPMNKILC